MRDRIINLMKQLGLSQKNFAAEICISEGALSSIFNGRTKPTLNTLTNIHERFPEVNLAWLVDGKGDMFVTDGSTPVSDNFTGQFAFPSESSGTASTSMVAATPLSGGQTGVPPTSVPASNVQNIDKPARKIAEIRIFYDDGTFETFSGKL